VRLLADENFPRPAVEALRARGHDVAWVRTDMPGADDDQVLARATAEGRLLVTLDKDFGELAFRAGLPAHCGIILFRVRQKSPSHVARVAARVLDSGADWAGHFAVATEDRVRLRPLP
jgi:predicted nuclease of predicted toxin-antitoxin system